MIRVRDVMIGVRVRQQTTSSVTVRYLVQWLAAQGDDLAAWLATTGLCPDDLASPDVRIPLDAFDALWARSVARDPAIGLHLIDRFPPGQMHLVTHLAMRAATVAAAMQAVERYMTVTDPLDCITCSVENAIAVIRYRHPALANGTRTNPGFVEHLLAMTYVLLTRGTERPVPLLAVHFAGPQLAAEPAYVARFGVKPRFAAGENALLLERTVLDWPLLTRDDYLRGLLERLAAERLPTAPAVSTAERLAERLRESWLEGRPMDLAGAAAALETTVSRLRARLAAEDASFRSIHDAARREVACIHFAGALSIGEISYLLGFSEPAALQHAVRRWFGESVGETRARLKGAAPSILK